MHINISYIATKIALLLSIVANFRLRPVNVSLCNRSKVTTIFATVFVELRKFNNSVPRKAHKIRVTSAYN